jgi:hypothetical protein
LWNSYDNEEIYESLTGEKDSIPEFQFNWISPEVPAIHWPAEIQLPHPPHVQEKPIQAQPGQPQQTQPQQLNDQHNLPIPEVHPQTTPSVPPKQQIPLSDRILREKKEIDDSELHTGIKKKCKSLRRKAQAVVKRLAPGAFSPKPGGPLTSASQQ